MLCVTEGFVNYIRTVWSHLLHMLTVTTHIHTPHDLAQHCGPYWDRWTDVQMDTMPFHRPCPALHAVWAVLITI